MWCFRAKERKKSICNCISLWWQISLQVLYSFIIHSMAAQACSRSLFLASSEYCIWLLKQINWMIHILGHYWLLCLATFPHTFRQGCSLQPTPSGWCSSAKMGTSHPMVGQLWMSHLHGATIVLLSGDKPLWCRGSSGTGTVYIVDTVPCGSMP